MAQLCIRAGMHLVRDGFTGFRGFTAPTWIATHVNVMLGPVFCSSMTQLCICTGMHLVRDGFANSRGFTAPASHVNVMLGPILREPTLGSKNTTRKLSSSVSIIENMRTSYSRH